MFLNSRLVVVDDKRTHLKGIKDTLDALRLDCHSRLYDEEDVVNWTVLRGTRILFIDKNLRAGVTMGGGQQSAFAAISEVISKLICPKSGPYGLILWAEEPDLEGLKLFLQERLSKDSPALLPVFCEQLRKSDYINTTTGDLIEPERLKRDILTKMSNSPQMKALFSWERDVVNAMDEVLQSVVDLVPAPTRGTTDFAAELGKVLYRLSQAGSGIDGAAQNPRESINRVLVPILADRITEHDAEGDAEDTWRRALVEADGKFASVRVQAAVNSAIHISYVNPIKAGAIKSTDLGAVVEYPFTDVAESLSANFGLTEALLSSDAFFGMSEEDRKTVSLRLILIGASCDHAQPKPGTMLYVLALEWPFKNLDGAKEEGSRLYQKKNSKIDADWRSPTLLVGHDRVPGKISAFLNCTISVPRETAENWQPVMRFREELVSKLTQEFARHLSRPGIVSLSPTG